MSQYGVNPDGTQFVMLRRATATPDEATAVSARAVELHVVQNWFDELDRIVPLE